MKVIVSVLTAGMILLSGTAHASIKIGPGPIKVGPACSLTSQDHARIRIESSGCSLAPRNR